MISLGVMQGRCSEIVRGKIQSFPWTTWEHEFELLRNIGISRLEWTIDSENFWENPVNTEDGRRRISALSLENEIIIDSLTADCFMQSPFFKLHLNSRMRALDELKALVNNSAAIGVRKIVLPLVDNSSISGDERSLFIDEILKFADTLNEVGIIFCVESDFGPAELLSLVNEFPPEMLGVNYDSGNSASLGFDPIEEIVTYGHRIGNVHLKDRLRGGGTVPFGHGDCNFQSVINALFKSGYTGNYILQGARATDEDHLGIINEYQKFLSKIKIEGRSIYGC